MKRTTRIEGFSLLEFAIIIAILAIVSTIAVASLAAAPDSAREASAEATLRAISSAQSTALNTTGSYQRLSVLVERGLVDHAFSASPCERNGYRYTESGGGPTIVYTAVPVSLEDGVRRFRMRAEDGLIRYTDTGADPTDASPVLGSAP